MEARFIWFVLQNLRYTLYSLTSASLSVSYNDHLTITFSIWRHLILKHPFSCYLFSCFLSGTKFPWYVFQQVTLVEFLERSLYMLKISLQSAGVQYKHFKSFFIVCFYNLVLLSHPRKLLKEIGQFQSSYSVRKHNFVVSNISICFLREYGIDFLQLVFLGFGFLYTHLVKSFLPLRCLYVDKRGNNWVDEEFKMVSNLV